MFWRVNVFKNHFSMTFRLTLKFWTVMKYAFLSIVKQICNHVIYC